MAGYSGTPLAKKLSIGVDHVVALVGDSGSFDPVALDPLPAGVELRHDLRRRNDVVVCFVQRRSELERQIGRLAEHVHPDRVLWVAWPKKSSGVPTDMTEDVVREVALPLGLVDTKVCAVDETWSGLKLVWRVERRG